MDQSTQIRLIEAALANIEARTTDMVGEVAGVPVERYIAPERLSREREILFRGFPLAVGFASQVARPGDFITAECGHVPVLVVRGRDGALRAFINACRHRGTRLEDAPCGAGRTKLVCPYHAWTYDTTGSLQGIPHSEGFAGVDRGALGLVELPVEPRHGLVYVRPSPGAALDLDGYLGPLVAELSSFGFDDHVLFAPSVRTAKMNWKLMQDTSFETYHFRSVHERTIYPMFLDNTGVFAWSEPHLRMVLPKRSIRDLRAADPAAWRIRDHANLIYGIFPNTIVLVQPDHAMVVTAWPVDTDTTRVAAGMLVPREPESDKARAHWAKNEAIFWAAIGEDLAMAERMQATLRSGANDRMLLGRFEHLIAKYHAAVERALNRSRSPDPVTASGSPPR